MRLKVQGVEVTWLKRHTDFDARPLAFTNPWIREQPKQTLWDPWTGLRYELLCGVGFVNGSR